RIFILLDACYSGGHSAREKSIETAKSADFQILDDEVVRAKDLGQKDLVLIASGGSGQLSFERPDGSISVMTAELIALMQRKNRLDVAETFQHLVTSVPQYVKLNIPGAEPQIPVYSGSLQAPLFLIPATDAAARFND
ncbi:MAG: hypothetical protein KDA96_20845, partial [Planctomycetaceae bacterium]|nr:hypothetical protein [Planctomycetaceae bacterium]